jgi:very-short-patch-repair endonuclease
MKTRQSQRLKHLSGLISKAKANQSRGNGYSQRMKRTPTEAEERLFWVLRQNGIVFSFQPFVFDESRLFLPDFIIQCSGRFAKLGVEVDGKQHEKQRLYDFKRTVWLWRKRRIKVIRFTNDQVKMNIEGVLDSIMAYKPMTESEKSINRYCGNFSSPIPIDNNGMYQIYQKE